MRDHRAGRLASDTWEARPVQALLWLQRGLTEPRGEAVIPTEQKLLGRWHGGGVGGEESRHVQKLCSPGSGGCFAVSGAGASGWGPQSPRAGHPPGSETQGGGSPQAPVFLGLGSIKLIHFNCCTTFDV